MTNRRSSSYGLTNKDLVYLCALRYALGRGTYIVSVIADEIKKARLTPQAQQQAWSEIHKCAELGMDCDKQRWLELKEVLAKRIEKRYTKYLLDPLKGWTTQFYSPQD